MTPDDVIASLRAMGNAEKAEEMAAYHKVPRVYLGIANPVLDQQAREWRQGLDAEARLALAGALWDSNIHEARVAAAKLLTQARIRPDDTAIWTMISGWVPDFDAWAIADHASIAGAKRLVADPSRLDVVETWTQSEHVWSQRAALVMTLPWARLRHPKLDEVAARERILSWAAGYVQTKNWPLHRAVAWWLRDLSRRAPETTQAFLDQHGEIMSPSARREAGRLLLPKKTATPP